jgi:prevent-host-death family protein
MNATISDLRHKTGEILEAVDRGETVHVLYRGKECAVIVPPTKRAKNRRSMRDHPACGMWADRKDMEDVHAWLRKIREPRFRGLWGRHPRDRKRQALPAH